MRDWKNQLHMECQPLERIEDPGFNEDYRLLRTEAQFEDLLC